MGGETDEHCCCCNNRQFILAWSSCIRLLPHPYLFTNPLLFRFPSPSFFWSNDNPEIIELTLFFFFFCLKKKCSFIISFTSSRFFLDLDAIAIISLWNCLDLRCLNVPLTFFLVFFVFFEERNRHVHWVYNPVKTNKIH